MKNSLFYSIIFIGIAFVCYAQEIDSIKEKALYDKNVDVSARYDYFSITLETSEDQFLIDESAERLAKFSSSLNQEKEALQLIENSIDRLNAQGLNANRLELAKARILWKMGDAENSESILKHALSQQWENADRIYLDILLENDEFNKALQLEIDLKQSGTGINGDALDVLKISILYKLNHPDVNLYPAVRRGLEFNDPEIETALSAISKSLDSDHTRALQCLDNEDKNSGIFSESDSDYHANFPLYKTVIYVLKDDPNGFKESLNEYIDRNPDRKEDVLNDIKRVCDLISDCDLHKNKSFGGAYFQHAFDIVLPFLEEDKEKYVMLYHPMLFFKARGLHEEEKNDEAAEICLELMDNDMVDQKTKAKATFWYGALQALKKQRQLAKDMLMAALEYAENDDCAAEIMYWLAMIESSFLETDRAEQLIDTALLYIPENEYRPHVLLTQRRLEGFKKGLQKRRQTKRYKVMMEEKNKKNALR